MCILWVSPSIIDAARSIGNYNKYSFQVLHNVIMMKVFAFSFCLIKPKVIVLVRSIVYVILMGSRIPGHKINLPFIPHYSTLFDTTMEVLCIMKFASSVEDVPAVVILFVLKSIGYSASRFDIVLQSNPAFRFGMKIAPDGYDWWDRHSLVIAYAKLGWVQNTLI